MTRLFLLLAAWLLCLPLHAQDVTRSHGRSIGINHTNIAVIINNADSLSIAIGEYYAKARHIPSVNVIRVSFPIGASALSIEEFARVKAEVDAMTPSNVQAYALTWAAPYRVACMSITSAFAFGYDAAFCADRCAPTRPNMYFNSASRNPASEFDIRPTMMLAGRSFAQVKELIDRGVASDGTYPRGTAYLMITSDKARGTRVPAYAEVETVAAGLTHIETLKQDKLTNRDDVMFYFTGVTHVEALNTLKFLPGAVADHLTSAGGQLVDSYQMSALDWLAAGATGSYGAVVEPCNFPQKFPHPAVVIGRYIRGESLIEAYWKSVLWPGQGVFVGEPLATPYQMRR